MYKYLNFTIALSSGLILGIIFPKYDLYLFLSKVFIRLSYFSLIPFLFFSLCLGIENLIDSKKFIKSFSKIVFYSLIINLIAVVFTIFFTISYIPRRIPILEKIGTNLELFEIESFLDTFLPKNILTIFTQKEPNLIAIYIFSLIIGISFFKLKQKVRILNETLLALTNIFYVINSFIVQILNFGMVFLMAGFTANFILFKEYNIYLNSILYFTLSTILIVFIVLPLIASYFLKNFKAPYKTIFSSLKSIIFSAISLDVYAPYSLLIEDIKNEKIEVKKSFISYIPLINYLAKFGTIFISTISFFLILKSYSSLPISVYEIIYISLLSFIFSLAFPNITFNLIYVIVALYSTYTRGIDLNYTNLEPIVPFLTAFTLMINFTSNILILKIANDKKVL